MHAGLAVGLLVFCCLCDRKTQITKLRPQKEVSRIDSPPYLPGNVMFPLQHIAVYSPPQPSHLFIWLLWVRATWWLVTSSLSCIRGLERNTDSSLVLGHCHHPRGIFLWLQYTCIKLHTFERKMGHSVSHHPSNVLEGSSWVHLGHTDQIHACSQVSDKYPGICWYLRWYVVFPRNSSVLLIPKYPINLSKSICTQITGT
jgi:hypothetical protein